ncbi:thiol peroxidase [Aquimarina mytili]|uniref:Thiol peroxidase n=1 Tax=Aquimarina mytili TaxID=874423 RepID=A0A936ZUE8_9FLAO|nr:thiol peroxidase [Aquimarina mytili]MBL0685769.1 thiol peroxidase [Aquimarina mytili]
MATITLKGNEMHTSGNLPAIGQKAPDFELVNTDLSISRLSDYRGSKVILNIFPSVDTGICAASVREFNKEASNLKNTKVLCISRDLPFAQARFCGAEGLEDVINSSDFRDGKFGKDYGVEITDGPMKGLHSRAVVVLDEEGVVAYTEQVPEIVQEPNYAAALKTLS